MTKLNVKESFWFPTLYKGEKKSKWPVGTVRVDILDRNDFHIRSRRNLEIMEEIYDIKWYEFFCYGFANVSHQGYVAHGLFGKHKVTYYMYKHSGRNNMGDVFFYFGKGHKLYLGMAKELSIRSSWLKEDGNPHRWVMSALNNYERWMVMVSHRLFHPKSTLSNRAKTNLSTKLIDVLKDTRKVSLLKKYLLKGYMYETKTIQS